MGIMMKTDEKVPLVIWKMDILERAIKTWGPNAQIDMLIEEMAELIVSLKHLKRGRCDWDAVCEEIADVKIMISQIEMIDDVSTKVATKELEKIKRLEKRLNAKK